MLAMPKHGFVFLSTTKTGSTSIHQHLLREAQMLARRPPSLKHTNARNFEREFAPILARHGFERSSYELVCIVREPVSWAMSWWRYRSRESLRGQSNYTGDMDFSEFVDRLTTDRITLGSASSFVKNKRGDVIVERIYKYDNINEAIRWMCAKAQLPDPELPTVNVSPPREAKLTDETRQQLETFYASDYEIYDKAL